MSLSAGLAVTCDTFSPGGKARVLEDGWMHSATTPLASAQRWGAIPATRSAVRSQSRAQAQHKGRGSELRPSRGGRCAPVYRPGRKGRAGRSDVPWVYGSSQTGCSPVSRGHPTFNHLCASAYAPPSAWNALLMSSPYLNTEHLSRPHSNFDLNHLSSQ